MWSKKRMPVEIREYVYAVAFSPDGQFLAVGAYNGQGTIWLLDPATGQTIRKLTVRLSR